MTAQQPEGLPENYQAIQFESEEAEHAFQIAVDEAPDFIITAYILAMAEDALSFGFNASAYILQAAAIRIMTPSIVAVGPSAN